MSACSDVEANVWRDAIQRSIASQGKAVEGRSSNIIQFNSPLTTEIKSIGAAFGKPGSFVRRMPVHRSATVGPTTDLNQVIIKNTLAVKESTISNTSLQHISRSQSIATPSHVQTLAPRRIDRIRLEALLADVWSPALPYPGMNMRRTEQLKGSADQIIRKLSIASLASSFHPGKRSGSHTSMSKLQCGSQEPRTSSRAGKQHSIENKKPARLPLSELLPADFELQRPAKRKNALRTLTMTIERPFSPLLGGNGGDSKDRIQRAQSLREQRRINTPAIIDSSGSHPVEERPPPPERCDLNVASNHAQSRGNSIQTDIAVLESENKKTKLGRLRRIFG